MGYNQCQCRSYTPFDQPLGNDTILSGYGALTCSPYGHRISFRAYEKTIGRRIFSPASRHGYLTCASGFSNRGCAYRILQTAPCGGSPCYSANGSSHKDPWRAHTSTRAHPAGYKKGGITLVTPPDE